MEFEREHLLDKKVIFERKYNEQLKEKERNSHEGNRIEANECYFMMLGSKGILTPMIPDFSALRAPEMQMIL